MRQDELVRPAMTLGELLVGDREAVEPQDAAAAMPLKEGSPAEASESEDTPEGARLTGHAPAPDDDAITAAGLRRIDGKFCSIYTDLPEDPAIDGIPRTVDFAIPQFAKYLRIPSEKYEGWRQIGCLVKDRSRFEEAGLWRADLPPFRNGFQLGDRFWVYEQPTDYFRAHLVLHEIVHGLMRDFCGGTGPPWYREGMAEYLATHRGIGSRVQTGIMPRTRDEVPGWGRIAAIQRAFEKGEARMLRDVWSFQNNDYLEDEPYAWSWAAVAYLEGLPTFRSRFRAALAHAADPSPQFNERLQVQYLDELRELDEQWQIFVSQIAYGYDFRRMAVQYGAGKPLEPGTTEVRISAEHGWQSTGVLLERGVLYEIVAEGRFQIAQGATPWISEPGGVTLRYHRGVPLGTLMGNLRLETPRPGLANLTSPIPIGARRQVQPAESGTLFLMINDHPAEFNDNQGDVLVRIRSQDPTTETR